MSDLYRCACGQLVTEGLDRMGHERECVATLRARVVALTDIVRRASYLNESNPHLAARAAAVLADTGEK